MLLLQQKRKELGLTQEQVARALDVSIRTVQSWESAEYGMAIGNLRKVARLYGLSLDELMDLIDKQREDQHAKN